MSITIRRHTQEEREYYVCLPASYQQGDRRYPVLYLQDGDRLLPVLEELLDPGYDRDGIALCEYIIVGTIPRNRGDDYTPWQAPSLKRGLPPFGGKGDLYLDYLAGHLKPRIDRDYRTLPDPANTAIAGVSLGGLISLYAIYRQPCFGCAASISGSFWYPGFLSFLQEHTPCSPDVRVLLISSRTEGLGELPPLCSAVDCQKQVLALLKRQLTVKDVPLIWDDGGHMDHIDLRLDQALRWICKNR